MGIEPWRVEERQTNRNLVCRICSGIFLSPHTCKSCRKTLCLKCAKSTSHICRDPILLKAPYRIIRKLSGIMLYCKYRPKGCIYKDIMEEVLKHEEWCYHQPATHIQYEVQQDTALGSLLQIVLDKSNRNRNSHSHLQQEIQTLKKLQNQIIETEITQQQTISALTADLQEQNRIKEEILEKLAATQNIVKTPSQAKLHIYNQNSYNRFKKLIQESWKNFVDFERSVYDELKYALNDFHLATSKPLAPQKRSTSLEACKRNKNKASVSPNKIIRSAKKAVKLQNLK